MQRLLVALLDLAADVQQERAVGGVDDAHAVDGVDRGGDRVPLLLVGGVDRDVAQQLVLGTSTRSTAPMIPPASPIALATWPSMPGRWAISTRMVSEYWADGVMLMAGACRLAAARPL